MSNSSTIYGNMFTILEICQNLNKSSDAIEACLIANLFAPEMRKCLRSMALVLFSEEPKVTESLSIRYALLGLTIGRCEASTSKGSISCSLEDGKLRIKLETKNRQIQSKYNEIISDYLGEWSPS